MGERTFRFPRIRNVVVRLVTSVLVVGLLIVVIDVAVVVVRYELQYRDLQTVLREFPGLTRAVAYARLRSMGVTGFEIIGEPMTNFGSEWPADGDIAVPFRLVTHDVICGTYAGAIVRFRGDRVTSVREEVWQSSCL